jgi:hypothetical protein
MTQNRLHQFFFLILTLLLVSCAPYVLVEGKYSASAENFEVELPSGWRKHEMAFDQNPASRSILEELEKRRTLSWDALRLTRDGLLLQQIGIGKVTLDRELPHTKKRFSKDLLPQELAELIIDDIRSNPDITDFKVFENSPAKVGGQPGFKLVFTYQTKNRLTIKTAYYGVKLGDWYYYLAYQAPQRFYFDKDYPVFEKVKESFKFLRADTA